MPSTVIILSVMLIDQTATPFMYNSAGIASVALPNTFSHPSVAAVCVVPIKRASHAPHFVKPPLPPAGFAQTGVTPSVLSVRTCPAVPAAAGADNLLFAAVCASAALASAVSAVLCAVAALANAVSAVLCAVAALASAVSAVLCAVAALASAVEIRFRNLFQ